MIRRLLVIAALALSVLPASAGIVTLSGDVLEAAPSAGGEAHISLVDTRLAIGNVFSLTFPADGLQTAALEPGTPVFEYLVKFEPLSGQGGARGSVTFDGLIYGLYGSDMQAEEVPGFPNTADRVWVSPDRFTLNFELNVNGGISNEFRVVVGQPLPVPSSLVLALLALALAGWMLRDQSAAARSGLHLGRSEVALL